MSRMSLVITSLCAVVAGFLLMKNFQVPESQKISTPPETKVASAGTTTPTTFENWHEFIPESNKFRVLLPALPQNAKEKQGDPNTKELRYYDMYVSEADDGSIYMISIITNIDEKSPKIDATVLSRIMNEMLKANPQSKIKKMDMGQYKNKPAMDFSIENNDISIEGKAFTEDNTLIVLTSVSKTENYNRAAFDFFINSFEFLPGAKK